jgi:hypothetical protein
VFELIVTDSFGTASAGDRVTVTVSAPGDTPPTANAGVVSRKWWKFSGAVLRGV